MLRTLLVCLCLTCTVWAEGPVTSTSPSPQSPELQLLTLLVSQTSGTADLLGVNAVQEKIAERMRTLGLTVEWIQNPAGKSVSAKLLVGTRKGRESKFITLVGHADTVFEKLNPFWLSSDGKIAHGSGVADDKGGVVVGLSAIEELLKAGDPKYSLRLVIAPSEETGSQGFHELWKTYSEDSALIVGLEPALESGDIIASHKGVRWYHIKIRGREAHAGVNHPHGINACQELAIKVNLLQRLTDYKTGTTVSIGHLEGGKDKFNIVCGAAEAKIDVRFASQETGQKVFAKIDAILGHSEVKSFTAQDTTRIEVLIAADLPAFPRSPQSAVTIAQYLSFVQKLEGRSVQAIPTGGAADLNFMARKGVIILDGAGPVGGGYHTAEEFIEVESLKTRAQSLAELLKHF